MLPPSFGCSGVTCWRRLRDWQALGVWRELHLVLLDHLAALGALDWSRACLDSASIRALAGGPAVWPNPTDRGRPGTKRHLVADANGVPLAVVLTGANVHDSRALEAAVDAVGPVRDGRPGRPRRRPVKLYGDKAYDSGRCRRAPKARRIEPRIARRGVSRASGWGGTGGR